MAFDLSTAKPLSGGFDISTARPVEEESPPSNPLAGLSAAEMLEHPIIKQKISELRSQGLGESEANRIALTTMPKEVERQSKMEAVRARNPYLADEIAGMSKGEQFLVGAGEGFASLGRGVGLMEPKDEFSKMADDALRGQSSIASGGKLVGQAGPFLPVGGLVGGIASTPLRVMAAGGVGATEGGIIAKGEGGSSEDVVVGAGTGLLLGAGGEVLAPVINRFGRGLVKRISGKDVDNVLTEAGTPTPEFQEALDKASIKFEDIVKEASETKQVTQKFAQAANEKSALDMAIESAQPSKARIEAARAMGFDPEEVPLPVLSESQAVNEIGGALAAVPGNTAGTQLDDFAKALGMKADDLITEMGGSLDRPQASTDLLKKMQTTRDAMYQAESKAYDAVREAIDPSIPVNAKPMIRQMTQDAKAVGGVSKLDGPTRRVFRTLNDNPTYGRIDRERKRIGAALHKKEGPYANAESSELSRLYSQLTSLQEEVAKAAEPSWMPYVTRDARESVKSAYSPMALWDKAKQQTIARKTLEEQSQMLFGRNLSDPMVPKLIDGLKGITGKNGKKFAEIVNAIPAEDRPAMMATALNGVFTASNSVNKNFTATAFTKWMDELKRSPSAYKAVSSNLPEGGMKRLESLNTLARGLADVERKRTRTGIVKTMFDDFDKANGLAAKLYDIAEQSPIGVSNTVRLTSNIAKMATKEKNPTIQAVDNLISSSHFKKAFIEAANDPDGLAAKRAQRVLEQSKPYKDFVASKGPKVQASIASMGLIPWLVSDSETEEE